MKQKVAFFDIDGTILRSGLYREMIFEMVSHGELPKIVKREYAADLKHWQERADSHAFDKFVDASVRSYEKHILEVPFAVVDEAAARVIKKQGDKIYIYTRNLIEHLRRDGYFLVAISGSQIEAVSRFAQKYNFDHYVGQVFERGDNGFYTGNIQKTHRDKDVIVDKIMHEFNLSKKDSVAVGDTRGDIGMLKSVERPIAFNPDENLLGVAKQNGWRIVLERKSVIYELESSRGSYRLVE